MHLQIEALRSLATTYRSFHSVANEVSALEAAVELERDCRPERSSRQSRGGAGMGARVDPVERRLPGGETVGQGRQSAERSNQEHRCADRRRHRQSLAAVRAHAVLGKARVAELDDDPDTARELLEGALKPGSAADRSDVLTQLRAFGARRASGEGGRDC